MYPRATNGLGNLIVGYNETRDGCNWLEPVARTGSHNIVVGPGHSNSGEGGLVAGQANTISSLGAGVCGGYGNTADGPWASVSGGQYDKASANFSSISGGVSNVASGVKDANDVALGYGAWIGGGGGNTAQAPHSSIVGGQLNTTNGYGGVISAGWLNSTENNFSWVGGRGEQQSRRELLERDGWTGECDRR